MGLIRIGEDLHCHIPTVQASAARWFCGDELDRVAGEKHLIKLVQGQAAAGADYMDVNVDDYLIDAEIGKEGALKIMYHIFDLVERYGRGISMCIDSSDTDLLEAGLARYYEMRGAQAPMPLVNSVSATRLDPLALRERYRFSIVGMLLENLWESSGFSGVSTPESYHQTARFIFEKARQAGFEPGEVFFDPAVGPLATDLVGYTRRTFQGIRLIRQDADMEGVHICLGLSNCSDGLPRRLGLNRAYLRVAMEYGVDAAILNPARVTGKDLVDPWLLKLIRKVVESESDDPLLLLVDYAQGHPRPPEPQPRPALPNRFREAMADPSQPIYMLEMSPGAESVEHIYEMAEAARDTPLTLSITDTPSGNRTPGPDTIAMEIGRIMGRQPIVNLSCKSEDQDGLIRRVLGLYHQGFRNFFSVTGDYPAEGRASFDLDAVTLLMAMDGLRRGLDYPSLMPRGGEPLKDLFAGSAVSPFKYLEADAWGQYLKLWKKWRAGAEFFVTQVGWDVRKFQELKLYMNRIGMGNVPVIGSIFIMRMRLVSVLFRLRVAGMVIPRDLTSKYLGQFVPRKERNRIRPMNFVDLADWQNHMSWRQAALLAHILVKGLGYRGIDLAGVADVEEAMTVLEMIRELESRDWRESYEEYRAGNGKREMQFAPEGGFYLFPEGDDALLVDGPFQQADRSEYTRPNRGMTRLHSMFFKDGTSGYEMLKWAVGRPEGSRLERLATLGEQAIKTLTLGCEMCGDCRIPDLQFMCPEPSWGCAKRLLNGPCGGADENGLCEVYPERRCYWGKVIESALQKNEVGELCKFLPPKDHRLLHTSSWRNDVLGLCPKPLELGGPEGGLPEGSHAKAQGQSGSPWHTRGATAQGAPQTKPE